MHTLEERLADLNARRQESRLGGGQKRIDAQHKKSELTARKRLDLLVDPGSFTGIGAFVRHRALVFEMAGA